MVLCVFLCLAMGYLLGCIQTGFIIGKINHIDIRKEGSGNAGSTKYTENPWKDSGTADLPW